MEGNPYRRGTVGAAACPDALEFHTSNRRGESLPLEGKVVRLKPDRMRSKVTASYQLMAIIGGFDLIRQPLRAASFSSRRSLCPEHPTAYFY